MRWKNYGVLVVLLGRFGMIDPRFWKGKKVLITGHTGFKGSWLSIWLLKLGANVIGFGLDPNTKKDNFVLSGLSAKLADIRGDIRDKSLLEKVITDYRPEIIFHLAAQPLVRYSYKKPIETYDVNVMGTINVMECIRSFDSVITGIMVTTDKCYENKEQIWGYRECDSMGGYDPYSSSKAAAEIAIGSWRNSFFNPDKYNEHGKAIASVRAGNVIGGGDWSTDRIIPDCIRAIEAGRPIEIRNPKAIRPWEHVLEPLSGYILLAQKMHENPKLFADAWNFGPSFDSILSVSDIVSSIIEIYGKGCMKTISLSDALHEAQILLLDITKAQQKLNWKPRLSSMDMLKMVVDWYRDYRDIDIFGLCESQIDNFSKRIPNDVI